MIQVSPVTFEHLPRALGIGVAAPRLSWKTTAPAGWRQRAYEVALSADGRVETTALIADTDSVLVTWPFSPLTSRERAEVSVRVHGEDGSTSEWSTPAPVEAGLLREGDWIASVVGPDWAEDAEALRRPPRVRRAFDLVGPIARARLYASAHGLYEVEINGVRVGDDALSPGWTVYGERLRYYTYDVTEHLVSGRNTVGSWLADGWYRGRLGFHGGYPNLYGSDIGLIAQLEIEYADGSRVVVATDDAWEVAASPIVTTGLYEGERYDARLQQDEWAGAADPSWRPARALPVDHRTLVAPEGAPVRCTEELAPVSVVRGASGGWILDFGQNISGRLRLRVHAESGREITLRHAEVLQDGELYTRPLRGAAATDVLITDGSPLEWEPRFTIHGFRYAEIDGWPARSRPARSSRGSTTPTWSARAGSSRRTRSSTACTRTSDGRCAITSSTSPRIVRSATNGWGGPATCRCSPPRRHTSTTARECSGRGCATSRSSSSPTGRCPGTSPSSPEETSGRRSARVRHGATSRS